MSFHKIVSFIKSGLRIIGCFGAFLLAPLPSLALIWLAFWLFIAEVLGVVEEIRE